MSGNNEGDDLSLNSKVANLINTLKTRSDILELIDSIPRLRIILLLIIYDKLSLTKLSNLLGRTKSTASHHLKKLDHLDILKISTKDSRGSIDAKVFELIEDFNPFETLNMEDVELLRDDLKDRILNLSLENNVKLLKVLKLLYEQIELYYHALESERPKQAQESLRKVKKEYLKSPFKYNIWFVSDNTLEKYKTLFKEFKGKLENLIQEELESDENTVRSNLIIHNLFPIQEIIKYDPETEHFLEFFKALEE
ncbi:MAG: ArsR family transcriptional regulator [Candidatus Lokiarchaeota archaeon]|nr:ArsR family transcriptional regulator [Candidatus Lokiarchaeota archaeon]